MIKIITIIIFSFLFSANAFAKIDSSYKKQIYEGCINDAKQNNDYNSASKNFCKCYANQFDKKFNNEQLLNFLNKSQQYQAKVVQNEIAPICYPKSKVSKKTNNSIIILKDCSPKIDGSFRKTKKRVGIEEWFFEIDRDQNTVAETVIYNDETLKKKREVLEDPSFSKFNIQKFEIINSTSRFIETDFNHDLEVMKIKLKIDLKLARVEDTAIITFSGEVMDNPNNPYMQCEIEK